jgi:hypothetical protein
VLGYLVHFLERLLLRLSHSFSLGIFRAIVAALNCVLSRPQIERSLIVLTRRSDDDSPRLLAKGCGTF